MRHILIDKLELAFDLEKDQIKKSRLEEQLKKSKVIFSKPVDITGTNYTLTIDWFLYGNVPIKVWKDFFDLCLENHHCDFTGHQDKQGIKVTFVNHCNKEWLPCLKHVKCNYTIDDNVITLS